MAGILSEKSGVFSFIFISTVAEYYFSVKLYHLSVFIIINYILFIFKKFKNQVKKSVLPAFVKIVSPFWCTVFFLKVRHIGRIKSVHHCFQPAWCRLLASSVMCVPLSAFQVASTALSTRPGTTTPGRKWPRQCTTLSSASCGSIRWAEEPSRPPVRWEGCAPGPWLPFLVLFHRSSSSQAEPHSQTVDFCTTDYRL